MTSPTDTQELVERYIAQCRDMSKDGEYVWWSNLADLITSHADELSALRAELAEAIEVVGVVATAGVDVSHTAIIFDPPRRADDVLRAARRLIEEGNL